MGLALRFLEEMQGLGWGVEGSRVRAGGRRVWRKGAENLSKETV